MDCTNPTTRRFPRSLAEAFADRDRAAWISGPYRREPLIFRRLSVAALVSVLALAAAAALITF